MVLASRQRNPLLFVQFFLQSLNVLILLELHQPQANNAFFQFLHFLLQLIISAWTLRNGSGQHFATAAALGEFKGQLFLGVRDGTHLLE